MSEGPVQALSPPKKEQFELRVIVWEAKDVATKDGGQSDVFITIQPRGENESDTPLELCSPHDLAPDLGAISPRPRAQVREAVDGHALVLDGRG